MPDKPLRPCAYPGCSELTHERYCPTHKKQETRQYDWKRKSAAQRGYGARWRKVRLMFIRRNPLCVECQKEGRITPATVVDHEILHKGNMERFWDPTNWQSLCTYHHNVKTAREDGGKSGHTDRKKCKD